MWIAVGGMPQKVPTIQLAVRGQPEIVNVEISIDEKLSLLMNQQNGLCRNYGPELTFNKCRKKYIETYLWETANCTIPGEPLLIINS